MDVFSDIDPARQAVRDAQRTGGTVGLVPTMGALHEGHLALIRAARGECSCVAVTIFVNPTQFGPAEDFESYPRTMKSDLAACEAAGVDIVFAPSVATMYPMGVKTTVHVRGLSEGLCGAHRPGHFDGVTTVVAKLLNILPADRAYFGEKDYQQLIVIKQMVHDLNLPTEIVACPTVREPDGLALSSRNQYLSPPQREQARVLNRSMRAALDRIAAGGTDTKGIVSGIRSEILDSGAATIDYVQIVDARTLEPLEIVDRPARIVLAVRLGSCRLIDNMPVVRYPHAQ